MAEEVVNSVLEKIDEGLKYLIRLSVEWRKHEINIITLLANRLAQRVSRRITELDYDVKRIWRPKVVVRRWGLELPEIEKPMIKLTYPGQSYIGTPQESEWYDIVDMPDPNNPSQTISVKLPKIPFIDLMVTDRALYAGTLAALSVTVHGIEIMPSEPLTTTRFVCANCVATPKEYGGKTAIVISPQAYSSIIPWSDTSCLGGMDSTKCYTMPQLTTDIPAGYIQITGYERKAIAIAPFILYFNESGSLTQKIKGFVALSTARITAILGGSSGQYYTGAMDTNATIVIVYIESSIPFEYASLYTTLGEFPFDQAPQGTCLMGSEKGVAVINVSGKTFYVLFKPELKQLST